VDTILAWYAEGTRLTGLLLFLAAVAGAFLAGYLVGRGTRPAAPPRPVPARGGDEHPLPALGSDEAQLMDLSAIRQAEAEPLPPIDPEPPRRR
jgi:hypothetical protein